MRRKIAGFVNRIAIGGMVVLLSGCTTLGVVATDNATQQRVARALCSDARFGVLLATTELNGATTEAQAYWTKYLAGAKLALETYCAE